MVRSKKALVGGIVMLALGGSLFQSFLTILFMKDSIISDIVNDVYGYYYYFSKSSYRNDLEDAFTVLLWVLVILSIIFVLIGIGLMCSKTEPAPSPATIGNTPQFIPCPKCGQLNGKKNTHCFSCRTELQKPQTAIPTQQPTVYGFPVEEPPIEESQYIRCPRCNMFNDKHNTQCTSCFAPLNIPAQSKHDSAWICHNCGRVNQSYFDCCICGELRP